MPNASAAQSFTNSVGIDTHIDLIGSSFQNYAQMVNALSYLGITNVRDTYDALNDAAEYDQMAKLLGLKYDFFIALGDAGVSWQLAQIAANPGIVSYVEGFNESDAWWQTYQGKTGIAATQAVQQTLYAAVKANPQLAHVGVIQSSFASLATFPSYGNMSAYADYANTHSYFGTGNNPGGNNWANYLVSLAQTVTPGKPTITTEAGWFTMSGNIHGVSQAVQAKYELNLLFEQAQAGVKLTYLWDLVDSHADPGNTNFEDHFGVFNADWTPKVAAVALHNLMQIMADTGTGTVPPGSLDYTLTGMPTTAGSALYEKTDGTFMLVLWNDVRLSGPVTQTDITVAPVPVTLQLTQPFTQISIFDPLTGTTSIQSFSDATTVQLAVPDHPVIVSLSQVPAPAGTVPAVVAPNQVLTTPGTLVHVQGLSIDAVSGSAPVTVRLSAGSNGLSLQDLAGHVLADGASTVTLTGTAATVNAELATLSYRGGSGLGADAISVALTTSTGATVTKSVPVSVVAAASAVVSGGPVLTLPTSFVLTAGSTAALPVLAMADPYAATHAGTVTLTITDLKGRLTVPGGLASVAGNGSASVVVTGSYAQVSAALAALTYTADGTPGQDRISFTVRDQAGLASSGQIAVTAGAAPVLSGPSLLQAKPGQAVQIGTTTLTDALAESGANQVSVTVTASHGVLSGAASGLSGSGTARLAMSGTVADVNAALATLTYVADANSTGDIISMQATDLYGGWTARPLTMATVSATPPTLTTTGPAQVSARATIPFAPLVIADPEAAAQGADVTVLLSSRLGTLAAAPAAGVTINAGAGGLQLTGALAAVNAALGQLSYAAGATIGTDLVSIAVSDALGGLASSQLKLDVVPRPTLVLPSVSQVRAGSTASLGALQVTDPFAGSQGTPVTVQVTSTLGSLTSTASGAVPAGNGTRAVSFTGTLGQVNTMLAALSYKAGANAGIDQVKVSVSDTYGGSVTQAMTLTDVAPQFTSVPNGLLLQPGGAAGLAGLTIADAADGVKAGTMIAHVSTIASLGGTVSVTAPNGAVLTGTGGNAITLTGTLAELNRALATLSYKAGTRLGVDTLVIDAWDQYGASKKVNLEVGIGTRVMPVATGGALQQIMGFTAGGAVLLDLRQALSETGWDGQTATLSRYMQVRATAAGTVIALSPNGTVASQHDVALLRGVTVSMGDVQLRSWLIPDASTAQAGVTLTDTGAGTATLSGEKSAVATALARATYAATTGTAADPTTNSVGLIGWNNVLDAGAGPNFLNGLQPGDVFRLNAAGQGMATISGFTTTNGDKLDLTRVLAGTDIGDLSEVGRVLTASVSNGNTTLSMVPADGTAAAIAVLTNVTTSVADLLAHNSLIRS